MEKVFGIDLGTTYSCVAGVDDEGKPFVVKNAEGTLTTPSVVFYESENEIVVGEDAKESSKMYPQQVASFAKRQMGKAGPVLNVNGRALRAQDVSAAVLKKIVDDANATLHEEGRLDDGEEIRRAVITCPAYFGMEEKNATKEAGQIAGLDVINIISEPTAAAIAYGMVHEGTRKNVLVYDLGGGTFDVTIIQIEPEKIEVICTGGDHTLGGKDWDDKILSWLDEQAKVQTGSTVSITDDPETFQEVRLVTEKAKKTLSSKPKAPVSFMLDGEKVRIELTRQKFDELTRPLLENTIQLVHDMLKEAAQKGLEAKAVDEVLLVGGSSRMPQVSERVGKEFGVPVRSFDPDEAVAKGAALFAVSKIDVSERTSAKAGAMSTAEIVDVTSRSFGTIAVDPQSRQPILCNMILKNDSVPAVYEQTFSTMDEKTSLLHIRIMENTLTERVGKPEDGREVGVVELAMDKPVPRGTGIWLQYTLNEDGMLEVVAKDTSSQKMVQSSFSVKNGMSEDELAQSQNFLFSSDIL